MLNQFSRTQLLIGDAAIDTLKNSRVAVFGIGGVGGYVCEGLARSGVGSFDLIDDDKVCLTNLNRQIIATRKTIGKYKVDVMKERISEINPDAQVYTHQCFFLPENAEEFPFEEYDYVVDAVDTVTAKIAIIMQAQAKGVPVISSMGAGNKLDATAFKVADIYKTSVDPLARVMRRELKKRGVKKLKVVYSEEKAVRPIDDASISCRNHCVCPPGTARKCTERRDIPGSVSFVPSVAGLIIAGEVVKDLAGVGNDPGGKARPVYIVTEIYEADFGCEERPEGQPLMVGVHLKSPNGQEKDILQEDAFLSAKEIDEGDSVTLVGGKLYKLV